MADPRLLSEDTLQDLRKRAQDAEWIYADAVLVMGHIDAQAARIRELETALREAYEGLLSAGPCEPSGAKCASHNYNRLPCDIAEAIEHAKKVLEAGE